MRRMLAAVAPLLFLGPRQVASDASSAPESEWLVKAVESMADVYGPGPNGPVFDYCFCSEDLNGDSIPETIVMFSRKERGLDMSHPSLGLDRHTLCDGFAVFTMTRHDLWPVFFVYDTYDGLSIRLDRVGDESYPSLVCDTDNAGKQMVWGWHDDREFPPHFMARLRDMKDESEYPWHAMDRVYVEEGK